MFIRPVIWNIAVPQMIPSQGGNGHFKLLLVNVQLKLAYVGALNRSSESVKVL